MTIEDINALLQFFVELPEQKKCDITPMRLHILCCLANWCPGAMTLELLRDGLVDGPRSRERFIKDLKEAV